MSCNHPRKNTKYIICSMMAVANEYFLSKIGDKQRYFRNVRYVTCLQIEPGPKRANIALS